MILDAPGTAPPRPPSWWTRWAVITARPRSSPGPRPPPRRCSAGHPDRAPAELQPLLAAHEAAGLLQLVPADDAIAMYEGALASWRRPRSSLAVACQVIRRGQAAALVSAGSTGGIVATARLRLRSVPGAPPALAVLPADPAEADPAGRRRRHRGPQAGDAAAVRPARGRLLPDRDGIAEPRVGLLSIGTEPGKGNELARRAYELLARRRRTVLCDHVHRQRRGRRPAGRRST